MKNIVEEDILDVELFERPLEVHNKVKHNLSGFYLDHRAKSFIEGEPRNLSISINNQACFEVIYVAIIFEFRLRGPLVANNVGITLSWH